MTYLANNKAVTLQELARLQHSGEPISMLTAYDATFSFLLDRCGVDLVLVGDSLGNVIQGKSSTLSVTLDNMAYHTSCVAPSVKRAMVITDMPFGSYLESPSLAIKSATKLISSGAEMVKLEGGEVVAETVRFLTDRGIPVCAHIGLIPQSVHALSGYKVQGRDEQSREKLLSDALILEEAGASLLVLEMLPAELSQTITAKLSSCATIGIGAGLHCHGQVLVLYDMLGVYPGKKGRFVRNFMSGCDSVEEAVISYVQAVKNRTYPAPEHCYE